MFRTIGLFLLSLPVNTDAFTQVKKEIPSVNYDSLFRPVKWRNIGPFRGGRSVCASGVIGDISTYYMGTTGGGLWKTTDMGVSWNNISDGYFKTGSVGAIAVAGSDPNIVYVGMGEHAPRGVMTHHGDGVYKSTDAGKTWKHTGLEQTQHISRVIVHPKDPNIVYVAAQGALYSPSKQRGIYKSTDGGKSWKNILYIDDKTGCVELSMDMNNPRILYAAMWEHGRRPWKVISGGPGSGLYKTTDDGENWEKMQEGLPKEMGKMAIAVSRSNPEKVYALIESDSDKELGGLFLSENGGKSWGLVTNDHRLIQRAWYYIELFVDPKNENTIYVLSAPALRSKDGGKTWENIDGVHGDYHDLWINPDNPDNLAMADDGGVVISFNGGKTWSSQHYPTGQFYRINTDNQFPYRIYGGQQDNTSVSIASREIGSFGIGPSSMTASAGGESAFLAFNPDDPRYVLGGSYQGTIEVLDTRSKGSTSIMAAPIQYLGMDAKDLKYRFNWNAPIIWSKHEPQTYYHAAQYLLKTSDMGKTWTEVSPDLTRNEKEKQGKGGGPYTNEAVGAENYGTLSYVIESPHEKGVIWTGSDDGLVHITRDGGKTWQNVTPKGLAECLINAIDVSPHDKATAYIATTRYKFNDHKPGLYKTTDYGKTWVKIDNGIPDGAFTRVVREDEKRRDLLFAGTETGVYISWNGGKDWHAFQLNLPLTPITDLKIHKDDLIAATSGRAFWILDDLSLIRQWKAVPDSFHLFQPEETVIVTGGSSLNSNDPSFTGSSVYGGINPATGVVLYYTLPGIGPDDLVTLEITDASGRLVRKLSSKPDSTYQRYDGGPSPEPVLSRNRGLNRFVWNLRYPTLPGVPGVYIESSYNGHKVIPGKYTVTLKAGNLKQSVTAEVLPNPLYETAGENYTAYDQVMREMEAQVTVMHTLVNDLHAKSKQIDELLKKLPAGNSFDEVRTKGQALSRKMKDWDEQMVQRKSKAYDDVENFPNKFTANYMFMMNQTESDIPKVNQPSLDRLKELNAQWAVLKRTADEINGTDIPAFNRLLWEKGIGAIWEK